MCINRLSDRPFIPLLFFLILYILFSADFGASPRAPFEAATKMAGRIIDEPMFGDKTTSFLFLAERMKIGPKVVKGRHKVKVYVKGRVPVSCGDELVCFGTLSNGIAVSNPGQFDFDSYLVRKNILGTVYLSDPHDLRVIRKGKGLIPSAIALKNLIVARFMEMMPGEQAVMLGSILFGSKASPVPKETEEIYRKCGIVHILVASGGPVSVLLGLCLVLRRTMNIGAAAHFFAASFVMWFFSSMAGLGPAILRAAVMGQIILLGGLIGRESDFYNSLSASAFFLLVFDRALIFDIGFQLSFAATWSFVYLAPVISSFLRVKLPGFVAESLSLAVAPFLATLPINVYYFSALSFVSIAANIIIVPLTEIITTLGFICSFLSVAAPFSARFPLLMAAVLVKVLDALAKFFSGIPGAFASFCQPHPVLILVYYGMLVYTIERMKSGKLSKQNIFYTAVLAAVVFIFAGMFSAGSAQKKLKVTFLDVGQGDSIVVSMPGGEHLLIDAGPPEAAGKVILPFLRKEGVNKIDLAVLTHAHDDHVGGFPKVIENIKISEIFDPGVPHTSSSYRRFLSLIAENAVKYSNPRAGQVVSFGDVRLQVLSPSVYMRSSDLNDSSIVLRLTYGGTSFVFMGDAGTRIEEKIMARGPVIKSDVLKVGHHGSRYSTSERFLRKVSPSIAVIQVGAVNRYGHPSPEIIKTLQEYVNRIYRTDRNGAVTVTSDGKTVFAASMKKT